MAEVAPFSKSPTTGEKHGIAISGYACRLPGAHDADAYWRLLSEGRCAVSSVTADRFDATRFYSPNVTAIGKSYSFTAGMLDDVWGFDPGFFGISHREAQQMDPQQRVLLQVVWEALEHAGVAVDRLTKSRTGVYIGASSSDHSQTFMGDPSRIDAPFMLGNTLSIISNRISYLFDLKGPCYTVDTACSSSLYALDQARRALEAGEIDTAIVGGVSLLLSPYSFIGFSRAGMLSPDGLCKAFDDSANGYVRAEGAVVFVLRREDVAQAEGDNVRGRLLATGVNADGRTTGVAMPSIDGQAALLARIRDDAGAQADDLAFIEAHGTGTQVGDYVEATAIGQVYGAGRSTPLPIGSAKTNVGHLEPASGLVGLLKAQLALEAGSLPPTLHIETLNHRVDFDALNLSPASDGAVIPARDKPWLAAVNSFGFGGANAHAIIEQAHPAPETASSENAAPLILTAASQEALRDLAGNWADELEQTENSAEMVNHAAWRRARHPHALIMQKPAPEGLRAFAEGRAVPAIVTGARVAAGRKTAFVFSGNGSQWVGMGQALLENDGAFLQAFDKVAQLFTAEGGPDIAALIAKPATEADLARAATVQPLIFALQVALVEALEARGITPDAVLGHSIGEVAAAWTAGALTLTDAVHLIRTRSNALEALHEQGRMAAVLSGVEDLTAVLSAFEAQDEAIKGAISIAADNNPRSSTISGTAAALKAFVAFAKTQRLAVKMLDIAYPYHSAALDPLKEQMVSELAGLTPRATHTTFVSAAFGEVRPGETLDADYWWTNTRGQVRFREGVAALAAEGCGCFVEIGPRPVLKNYVMESASAAGVTAQFAPTMDAKMAQGRGQGAAMADIAARIAVIGATLDEARFFGSKRPWSGALPKTPWRNAHFRAPLTPAGLDDNGHYGSRPLLGWRERVGEPIWRAHLDTAAAPWLADHAVQGVAVFPATGYAEIFAAVGAEVHGPGPIEVSGLDILQPLSLAGRVDLRTTFERSTGAAMIESRVATGGGDWTPHARARVRRDTDAPISDDTTDMVGSAQDIDALYKVLTDRGLVYGKAFRRLESMSTADGAGTFTLAGFDDADQIDGFALDPRLFDAALHAFASILGPDAPSMLPVRIGRLRVLAPGARPTTGGIKVLRQTPRGAALSLSLRDAAGDVIAEVDDLRLAAAPALATRTAQPAFWRETNVPIAVPGAAAAIPAPWRTPTARMMSLGLTQTDAPPLSDSSLLIDAACRRIAWETVAGLTGPEHALTADLLETVALNAEPLLARLLMALEEDGQFTRDEPTALTGVLDEVCAYPPLDLLLARLAVDAPERAADLMALPGLSLDLPNLLVAGLEVGERTGTAGGPLEWRALTDAALDIASEWDVGARLEVLILGAVPPAVQAAILAAPTLTRLTILAADKGQADLLKRRAGIAPRLCILAREELPDTARQFDLIVSADVLTWLTAVDLSDIAHATAPDAPLLATQPMPDLFSDMVAGQDAAWWDMDRPTHAPRGRRIGPAPLSQRLIAAGFEAVDTRRLAKGEQDILLITATGAAQKAKQSESDDQTTPANLVIFHEAASLKFAQNLSSAIIPDRPQTTLSRLSPPMKMPEEPWEGVVLLQATTGDDARRLTSAIGAVQNLLKMLSAPKRMRLVVVGAPGAEQDRLFAALAGYRRVLANERPELDLRVAAVAPDEIDRLAAIIQTPGGEAETILGHHVTTPRVEPISVDVAADGGARRLTLPRRGALDHMRWTTAERRAPEPGEIEISVRATGLNFRDVMWAQGLLPEEALEDGFAGPTLGMECAGVVARAGASSGFAEGERVIAFAPHALATHVTVTAETATRAPIGLPFEAAASLPTIFATAHYALIDLARIRAGEWVLIHGAAGGVGLAALQIAKAAGARVIATAGNPARRRLLTALGAEHVFDSRALRFADETRAVTGGGVDVVLNSLAGEAMERSVDCLRSFGRFIELGKRDFYEDTRLGLRPFRRNLTYFGVDLDQVLAERPDIGRRIFGDMSAAFESGAYAPPPYQAFDAEDALTAFRLMQKSGHLGKVVIRPPEAPAHARAAPARFTARDGWLVVGGLSGFGLSTAERLAARGARKLWLVSRSGKPGTDDGPRIARLIETGIAVETASLDVTDADAVADFVADAARDAIPLRGVVHSAMALRDKLASDLNDDDIDTVIAPKVAGAMALDAATRDVPLDQFILYSSATTLIGNPHQAAYVAANKALEAVAADRSAAGLPALSIGWGAISDAGYLTREDQARAMLDAMLDGAFLTQSQALDGLEQWLTHGDDSAAVTYAPMPWGRMARDLPILSTPMFERLNIDMNEAVSGDGAALKAELAAMSPREALKRVTALLIEETSAVLFQPASEIDPRRPLSEIGFDSLMAVELRMSIEERTGLALPLLSLADATTLADVAVKVVHLAQNGEDASEDTGLEDLIDRHVSDETVAIDDPRRDAVKKIAQGLTSLD